MILMPIDVGGSAAHLAPGTRAVVTHRRISGFGSTR